MSEVKPKEKDPAHKPWPKFDLKTVMAARDSGDFDRGDRPRDHLYASELGYCARAVWMGWHNPQPFDKEFTEGRGALGHAIEELMVEKLGMAKSGGLIVAREVSFRDEKVSGRADFFLRLKKGTPQFPLELKTTAAFDQFMDTPPNSHLLQLRWYLTQAPDAPFGLLTYYNLSSWGGGLGKWDTLRVERDDEAVEKRVSYLWRIVHQDREPACEAEDPTDCWDCKIHSDKRGVPT